MKKKPYISLYAFIKYYVKLLVTKGFDSESRQSERLHAPNFISNFYSFFRILDKMLHFWRSRQNFFSLALARKKVWLKLRYKRFLNLAEGVNRFCTQLFTSFYHLYLLRFRQAKFFRFMSFIINPIFSSLGVLDTKVEFFGIDNDSVSAIFLARYIARKVEMRFKVKELFTPIGREMKHLIKNTSAVLGYKIQFVGRLTRRGRVRTT